MESVLTLVRLRFVLLIKDAATRFNISSIAVSSILITWFDFSYLHIRALPLLADKSTSVLLWRYSLFRSFRSTKFALRVQTRRITFRFILNVPLKAWETTYSLSMAAERNKIWLICCYWGNLLPSWIAKDQLLQLFLSKKAFYKTLFLEF